MSPKYFMKRIIAGLLLVSMVILGQGMAMPSASLAQEPESIVSYGAGPVEVFIFTDYFCPPCQKIEPYLDVALPDLYRSGVRITFSDMPIYEKTPLFSRYFLYTAKAAKNFDEVMKIRRVLFDIAKRKAAQTEVDMIKILKSNQFDLSFLNVQSIFDEWTGLIKRFAVESTPTLIVTRPGKEVLKLSGGREIQEGLDRLRRELTASS